MSLAIPKIEFPSTHQSLLARLRGGSDDKAWPEFVDRYGLIVLRWCSKRLNNEELAKEVALDLLIDLPRRLKKFRLAREAGRFRGWLHTVVEHACTDLLRRRQHERIVLSQLITTDSMDELKKHLNQLFDQEIYDLAYAAVKKRLDTHSQGNALTLESYRFTAPVGFFRGEGLSNVEAAKQLGVDISFIEKARSNIKKMLAEEITRLEAGE